MKSTSVSELEDEVAALRRRVAELELALAEGRGPESAAEAARRRLATAALSHAPIVIWSVDRQGTLTFSEGRGSEGMRDVATGRNMFQRFHDVPQVEADLRRALAGEEFTATADLGDRVFESWMAPLRSEEGEIVGVLGVATDVTRRQRSEEMLQRTQLELERRVAERTAELEAANAALRTEIEQRVRAEEKTHEQAGILQSILDSMGDGVVVADNQGRLVLLNPAGAQMLGIDLDKLPTTEWAWFLSAFQLDSVTPYVHEQRPVVRAIHGESVDGEEMLVSGPGAPEGIWIQVTARPLRDKQGRQKGGVVVFRNVTDQKRAIAALRETEQRLHSMLDNMPSLVYLKDADGRYLLTNRAWQNFMQLGRDVLARTDHDFFPQQVADELRRNDRAVFDANAPFHFEETVPHASGPRIFLSVKFPLCDASGAPYAVCGISTDITERNQAEQQLRNERNFLKQLIRAHERDRQLMAYEIHDGLVQYMSAAAMHLENVAEEQGRLTARGRAALELTTHLSRRSVVEGRRIMSGLRPPILDEEGVVSAIVYLVAEQAVPGELAIDFKHQVSFDRLEPLLEGTLFRIVQEALTNVKRHSRADRAEVELVETDGHILLRVQDWGVGFDLKQVPADRFGLEGIRRRAALFGGRAEITTAPGQGTCVTVEMPIALAVR